MFFKGIFLTPTNIHTYVYVFNYTYIHQTKDNLILTIFLYTGFR